MHQLKILLLASVACFTAACSVPAVAATSAESATQPGSWGVNVQTLYHGPALKALNAQWVRIALSWKKVEQNGAGQYDWTDGDKAINYYLENGFHIICVLNLEQISPVYAAKASDKQAVLKAIAAWMGAAAQRYKGKGIVWELGNEPESFPMGDYWNNPATYAQMAKMGASAIRHSDPAAKVAALALAWMDRGFASKALAAGLLDGGNVNYLSFHGYHRKTIEPESGLEDDVNWLRAQGAAASSAGKTPPEVIDSEAGYSILPLNSPKTVTGWRLSVYTEDAQAAYVARHFIEEIYLGLPISIWYKDMHGETQYSLYYSDESDPKGLRPQGRVFQKLAQLLPDNPKSLKNDRYPVSVDSTSGAAQLHLRSFLRQDTENRQTLIVAVWNAVEAFDGKILRSRTFTRTEVLEKWGDTEKSDLVSIPTKVQIGSLTPASILSAQILSFQHGNQTEATASDSANKQQNTPGISMSVTATSMPTILVLTLHATPLPPSQLGVTR